MIEKNRSLQQSVWPILFPTKISRFSVFPLSSQFIAYFRPLIVALYPPHFFYLSFPLIPLAN
jgi:hypothetical protein